MKRLKGFTLTEVILSMMILSLCSVVLQLSMKTLKVESKHHHLLEDETAIWQIRRLLAQSEDLSFEEQALTFLYRDEECILKIKNGQIVHQIGNEIMMKDLSSTSFFEKDGCIWLRFTREEIKREAVLICEV